MKTSQQWAQFLIDFDAEPQTDIAKSLVADIMMDLPLIDHIAIARHILRLVIRQTRSTHELRGVVGLFSGGKDSTTFMHLLRFHLTHAGHANTGVGIEATREFVRATSAAWGLPLIEKTAEGDDSYQHLVKKYGFPGPGGHSMMFRHLKQRQFRKIRRDLVEPGQGYKQRVIFVAGMRHFESERRMANTQVTDREGSTVWVSPVAWWPTHLLREYRDLYDVPVNEVSDHLHMSGECLCGAFAKPGELDMIRMFYPETAVYLEGLQLEVAEAEQPACIWGQRPPSKGQLKGLSNAEAAQLQLLDWETENSDKAFYLCSKCEVLT